MDEKRFMTIEWHVNAFRPNGPDLCQPWAPPLSLRTSFVRRSATFIRPVPFLRDPIRLDRIGEHRWWAKIVDEKNHNPIRLVRMVEKMESTIRSLPFLKVMKLMDRTSQLIHHPCKGTVVLFNRGTQG